MDGEDCYVIESIPSTDIHKSNYGYGRRVMWVSNLSFMERKVEYSDAYGRPLKTQTISELKQIDQVHNKWWAMRREVINHQTGHRTILKFTMVDPLTDVSDSVFSARYLERER